MIREKATLQELADRFQVYTVVDPDGDAHAYDRRPLLNEDGWFGFGTVRSLDGFFDLDYTGDWKDSLHSPQHQYAVGERVIVWNESNVFAQARKMAEIKDGVMYTFYPYAENVPWAHYRRYDESLLGDPIAEWPEE